MMSDLKQMQIGQIVDFCIAYNERQKKAQQKANQPDTRKATQNDINAFFG